MTANQALALARRYTETYVEEHGGGGGKEYVRYDTTAAWNARTTLVAERGILYVYSDHDIYIDHETGDTIFVPGIKVGDGTSLLSALPFIDFSDGGGLPAGGSAGDILVQTDEGPSWVAPADRAEQDDSRPITAAAVYNEIGTINVALDHI